MTSILLSLVYGGGVLGLLGVLGVVGAEWHWALQMHQPWLIAIALVTFAVFYRQSPSVHAWLFALAFPVAVACVSMWTLLGFSAAAPATWQDAADNWGREWEAWSFGLTCLVFLYASLLTVCVVFWRVHEKDIMAKGMCLFLWIGEAYMLVENWLCNIVLPTAGSSVLQQSLDDALRIAEGLKPLGTKYACARAFEGGEWVVWGPTSMQIAIMVWLVWIHARATIGATEYVCGSCGKPHHFYNRKCPHCGDTWQGPSKG